jgi:hypothetical protein
MVKLQSLKIKGCRHVSDLVPLGGMVNLKSLWMRGVRRCLVWRPSKPLRILTYINDSRSVTRQR